MRQIHFFRGEHAKDAVMRSMRSGNGEKCSNIRPKSDSGMISEMRSHAVTCGRIRDNLSRKRQASTCFRGNKRNMRHIRHVRHPLSGKGSNYGSRRHLAYGLRGTITASPCVTYVTKPFVVSRSSARTPLPARRPDKMLDNSGYSLYNRACRRLTLVGFLLMKVALAMRAVGRSC